MKWMISYRFRTQGREYETIQVIDDHPATFVSNLIETGEYKVLRVYSAIEIGPSVRSSEIRRINKED